jgi:hypothetical protein
MRPIEWLEALLKRDGYAGLLREAGALPIAAYRLAAARCATWEVPTTLPTRAEVRAAAREIVRRTGVDTTVPESWQLARDCEAAGLLV